MNIDWSKVIPLIATPLLGGVGVLIYQFWIKPVNNYRNLKSKIAYDLTFYANAIEVAKGDLVYEKKRDEKDKIFREHAAKIDSVLNELPALYLKYLSTNYEHPEETVSELLGIATGIANDHDDLCAIRTAERYKKVKQHLNLK